MSEFTMEKNEIFQAYKSSNRFTAIWSVYGIGSFEDEHPYGDFDVMVYNGNAALIFGKTYGALYDAANSLILRSGDLHHVFVEGFEIVNNELSLITGS